MLTTRSDVHESATKAFAEQANLHLDQMEKLIPALAQYHNAVRLFFLASLLEADQLRGNIGYNAEFWLKEYEPRPFRTPRRLPALKPRRNDCDG
ncbi:MAG TPA: hypothetical protein PL196_02955 [Burkholderiaceae bacterium]|nr:hypothetical protein [Burkholderiaceae bacterium]